MIVFYRTASCPGCDAVAERLRDAVLAHRVVTLAPAEAVPGQASGVHAPLLVEGEAVTEGLPGIHAYLDELERELQLSRRVSGDACYLDPEQPGQCL